MATGLCADQPAHAMAALRWTGGTDAGATVALGPGPSVVGRAAGVQVRRVEPAVAPYHCLLDVTAQGAVTVTPLVATDAPSNGRWRIGAGTAEVIEGPAVATTTVPTGARRPGEWTAPLARPPRAAPPPEIEPVRAPSATGHPRPAATAGLLGGLVALAASAVAAVVAHQPALLVLGGAGAIGSVVTWVVQRRRGARAARSGRRRAAAELTAFDLALTGQRASAVAARWAGAVELADAVGRARDHDARLWERRRDHADHLDVVLGIGDVPWQPVIEAAGRARRGRDRGPRRS